MYNRENNSSLPFEIQMRLNDIYDGKNRRVNMDKKTLEVMDKFLLNDRRMLFSSCPIRYTTDIPYISKTLSNLSQTLKPIEKMKSDFIPKAFKKKFTLEKIKEKKATKEAMQKNIVKFKMLQMDPLERKKYLDKLKEKKKKLLESQLRHAEITKDQRSTEQTLIPPLKKEDLEFKCSNAKTQKVYKKLKELNEEFSYVTYMKESKMLSPNIEEYKTHKSSKSINYPMRERKQITQTQAIHHDTASISTSQQQITAESENSPEHKIHKRIKRIFFTKRATPPRADPLRASVKNEVRDFRASHRVDEILKGDKSKLKDLAALIDNNTIDFKKTYLVGTAKRGKTRHGGYISKDYDYNHNHSPHLSPSISHYSYTTPSSPKPPRSARPQRIHTNTNININTRSSVPLQDTKSSPKTSPKTSPNTKKHILEHSTAMVSPFYKYETNVPNNPQTPRLLQRGLGNYASTPNVRIHGSKSTQKRIIRGKNVNIYKRSSPKNSINKQISGFEKGGKTSSSGVLLQGNNMKVAYSPLCKSNSKESVQNIFHLTTSIYIYRKINIYRQPWERCE